MAQVIPATFIGIVVDEEDEWTGPDGTEKPPRVRLHLEVDEQDWVVVEALENVPGVTMVGRSVILDPTSALIVIKGAEEKPA